MNQRTASGSARRRPLLALGLGLMGTILTSATAWTGPAVAQAPVQPAADAEPVVMLVLDGSGSMWGKLGRDQKVTAVRDVLKQQLPKAPPMSLGLTAFGHRRTGDCSDVEVVSDPARGNVERVMAYLDKYNPKGKGPVGKAVRAAAETLEEKAPKDARRALILIADNADNCKVDTCELAQELHQSQPGLAIHVIALGVSKEETPALACLATTTGGRLHKAESAAEIAIALDLTLKAVAGPIGGAAPLPPATPAVAAPSPPKADPEPSGPPGVRLTAVLAPGGGEIVSGLRWKIIADDGVAKPAKSGQAPAAAGRVVYEGEERTPDLDLAPGSYRIEASFGLASVTQDVKVGAKGRTRLLVPLNAGVINVRDSGARNSASTDRVFYTLYAATAGPGDKPRALALSSDTAPVYNVPAGNYLIAAQQGLARVERSVAVAAGGLLDVDLPLYLGELRLSAAATESGPPLTRLLFQVFEDDPDAPSGLRELVRSSAAQPEFTLPAGSYLVVARQDEAEARERVTVKTGTRIVKALVLASGRLTLSARLPGRAQGRLDPDLISWRIERIGARGAKGEGAKGESGKAEAGKAEPAKSDRGEEVARAHAPEHALTLSAGRYRVEGRYGAINARTLREVEIKAGGTQALAVEFDAGLVTLAVPAAREGAATPAERGAAGTTWTILDSGGRQVWSTSQPAPRLALAAGRYTVRVESRNRKAEQAVQVASGDDKTIEVEPK